jgi:intracellular septation protein
VNFEGVTDVTDQTDIKTISPEETQAQLLKLLFELGPLVVYLTVYGMAGVYWGTGCFMVATLVSLTTSWSLHGRLPLMPLISCVLVLVFGGLTLWYHEEYFIKIKPTILNGLFAVVLFGGLAMGRSWLKYLFGDQFKLTEEGWRILTFRWACFFVVLAVLNEIVWRNTSTAFWLSFKPFGILPLTIIFAVSQLGLLKKHDASAN